MARRLTTNQEIAGCESILNMLFQNRILTLPSDPCVGQKTSFASTLGWNKVNSNSPSALIAGISKSWKNSLPFVCCGLGWMLVSEDMLGIGISFGCQQSIVLLSYIPFRHKGWIKYSLRISNSEQRKGCMVRKEQHSLSLACSLVSHIFLASRER